MANTGLDYTGKVVVRGKQIEELALELLYKDTSIAKGHVVLNTGTKHGMVKTETSTTATEQAYTGQALTADGGFNLFDYQINLVKGETKIDILQDTLRDTPFAEDMSAGAMNIDSSRFVQLATSQLGARVENNATKQRWQGITAATQTAIAALTANNAQGSISAAGKTKVAALTPTLRDGWLATALYNSSNASKTAGLGTFIKVLGTTIDASNIAAEYAKIYAAIPAVDRENTINPYILNAPLSHKAFMMIANNSVGAASNKNFLWENGEMSYNGLTINFVQLPENVVFGTPNNSLSVEMDLASDDNTMEVGEYANGSDVKYFRNVNAWAVHVARQASNVIYGV
jgi:hypothetical protein